MATVIDDRGTGDVEHLEVDLASSERWLLDPEAFEALTGWVLKPEGLCRGDVCAPIFRPDEVLADGRIDLVAAAPLIGRTAVADAGRGVAAIGATAADRGAAMTSLRAPDFTLQGMDGESVGLAGLRGKKVVLLAWSSW